MRRCSRRCNASADNRAAGGQRDSGAVREHHHTARGARRQGSAGQTTGRPRSRPRGHGHGSSGAVELGRYGSGPTGGSRTTFRIARSTDLPTSLPRVVLARGSGRLQQSQLSATAAAGDRAASVRQPSDSQRTATKSQAARSRAGDRSRRCLIERVVRSEAGRCGCHLSAHG
jgi:hypothetical protein